MLLAINGAIGFRTLRGAGSTVPCAWNTFVVVAGSFIPLVWPKFLIEGLASWPYEIVFIWIGIWAFESLAFFSSLALFALSRGKGSKSS